MFASFTRALLVTSALALAAGPIAAVGQTATPATPKVDAPVQPKAPTVQKADKKAPGRACTELKSNTQAHKDCVAQQARQKKDQATKPQANKAGGGSDKTAKKPVKKPEDAVKS